MLEDKTGGKIDMIEIIDVRDATPEEIKDHKEQDIEEGDESEQSSTSQNGAGKREKAQNVYYDIHADSGSQRRDDQSSS